MNLPLFSYNLLQAVLAPLMLPVALVYILTKPKYRFQFAMRTAGWRRRLPERKGMTIWIHTLSFGEVNAAMPLVNAVRDRWPDARIICSAGTESGYRYLEKRAGERVELITFPPYDIYPLCVATRNALRPDCFILVETDVWPNWLWSLYAAGTRMLFVNAAVSARAAGMLVKHKGISRLLYGPFDRIAAQSGDDAARFMSFCDEKQVVEAGNLKFDIPVSDDLKEMNGIVRKRFGFSCDDLVIVAGSTHQGEEEIILAAFLRIRARTRQTTRLVLAPRHPERGGEVHELAEKHGVKAVPVTHISGMNNPSQTSCDVVIIDTLGELASCYAAADLAFVGGSLVPVGGHNLLEPAACGVPVLFGPFVESCRDVACALEESNGGTRVANMEEFVEVAVNMLSDDSKRSAVGKNAAELVARNRGATDFYLGMIEDALASVAAGEIR